MRQATVEASSPVDVINREPVIDCQLSFSGWFHIF